MDPSNFGSFSSGGNSGGANGINVPNNGVTSGADPTVNSSQVNPGQAQGFVGAQPVRPAQPVVSGSTQQPRTVQSPMQQPMQFQPQMMTSGTEDVILGSGAEPKKSRKGLIVGIVLAMLVLVGVGILVAFSMGNMNGVSKEKGEQNFNIFANYILYEKTDDAQDLETEDTGQYALKGLAFYEHDKAKEFYALAMKYWNSFVYTYPEQDDNVSNKINEVGNELTFLERFADNGLISNDRILEIYYNGDEDTVIEEYAKYYADFRQDAEVFSDFMTIQDTYIGNIVQLLDLYSQEGCIVDAKEDAKCVEEKQLMNNEFYIDVVNVGRETAQYVSNVENKLVDDVIELNTLITKEGGNEK